MNYFDILLAKKLEDDRDPKVEGLSVTENGRYHEDGVVYDPVIVNVPETPLSKLTVTENGTYTAPSGTAYSEVDVDVPLPENAYLLKEIEDVEIATFTDGSDLPMPKLEVAIEPQQDLHGYDAPWVGGAGKNKLKVTATSQTINGVTFTVNDDGSVLVNGTTTAQTKFILGHINLTANTSYICNGTPQGGGSNIYAIYDNISGFKDFGNGSTYTPTEDETSVEIRIQIENGNTLTNKTFYPMIRLASVTDSTFAPYSNICPISGWDEVNVTRCGKNIATTEIYKNNYVLASDGTENYAPGFIITKPIKIDSSNSCYLSMIGEQSSSSDAIRVGFYDEFLNFISRLERSTPTPITIPNNAEYIRLSYRNIGPYFKDIQLEIGDEATAYEPYNGTTYTIDLDGTRYGGKVDLVSGVMTVDRKYLTIDNFNSFGDSGTSAGGLHWFDVRNELEGKSGNKNICSICGYVQNGWTSTITVMSVSISETIPVRIYDSSESLSDFKDKYPNLQVAYELATPLTIQLSPTVVKSLRGMNNVCADSGNILDLSYLAKEE